MDQKFSEFWESDKSLKHELGSRSSLLPVIASWSLTQKVAGLFKM